jgi:peptide/nickel transport system permease protein
MARHAVWRLVQAGPLLLLVSLISFSLLHLVPGDPALLMAGMGATPDMVEQVRHNLGLDQPLHVQLGLFYLHLAEGDLGRSFVLGQPVSEAILQRAPASLSIGAYSMLLTMIFGLATGVAAAVRHNGWTDQVVTVIALVGVSMPNFWLALVMIVLFAVHLGWFPTGGYVPPGEDLAGWLRTATMPAVALALMQIGLLTRITRATMLDVLGQDYIRTARAKGLGEGLVIWKHALANTTIPVITVVGLILSVLFSGSIVIETVFSVPGVGSLLGSAILSRDYPVIQGGLLFVAAALLLLNVGVDILYAAFDPRVRIGGH